MEAREKKIYSEEELARIEFRKFIFKGMEDIENNNLVEMDEVFTKLESKFGNAKI